MLLYYNMMRNILHLEISLNTIKIAQYLIVIHYINEMQYIDDGPYVNDKI